MHQFRKTIEKVDAGIYRVERALLLAAVTGMTVLIFLQVVQRSFSREVGKSTEMLGSVLGLFTDKPMSEETLATIDPFFFWGFAIVFLFLAVHAARRNRGAGQDVASLGMSVAVALVACAIFRAGIWGLREMLPTGVPGAQKYALGLLVWAGLLGASIITRTRGHIVIDAVKKKMGDDVIGVVSLVSGTLTGLFCGVLVWLGAAKTFGEYHEWVESEHLIARLYESAPVPQAIVTAAIPVCFALVGIRFFAQGVSDFLYGPPLPKPEETDVIDLDAPDSDALVDAAEGTDTPTGLIFGRPHVEGGAR